MQIKPSDFNAILSRRLLSFVSLIAGFVLLFICRQALALETGLHYYLIQRSDSGEIVRRGTAGSNGIAFDNIFLAPNTRYRAWVLQAATLDVGMVEITMPGNGRRLNAPDIFLAPSSTPDTDNDGLHEDGERIMGATSTDPDSDDDGLLDGAEVRQGSDPLDGVAVRTGIIGATDTPGEAVGICALNDIVAVADGSRGISVLNVFNGMQPLLIAQVETPGSATGVACAGNLIAVADGSAGLAVIDVSDPPAAKVTHQLQSLGNVIRVATEGKLAYVAMSSPRALAVVDMETGLELKRINFTEALHDVAVAGDYLYVLTSQKLTIYSLFANGMQLKGSLPVSGSVPPLSVGRPLFVGGDLAYVGSNSGYTVIDVGNPATPVIIGQPPTTQAIVHDLAANGSGLLLPVTSFSGSSSLRLSVYDSSDPTDVTQVITAFDTPGAPRAVGLYNGLAYVAASDAGLQVINYLAFDALGVPPTIELKTGGDTGDVVAGQLYRLTATVSDDVQVRNVEFYIDGVKVATDGNYPFEIRQIAPPLSEKQSIVVKARASDTGGNFTWTDEIVLGVTPDNVRPTVTSVIPANGKVVGGLNALTALISEPVDPAVIADNLLNLTHAGNDGVFDTVDDYSVTGGTIAFNENSLALTLSFTTPLQPGNYRATVADALADYSRNTLAAPFIWRFTIYDVGDDSDGDGVPDALEMVLGLSPDNSDSDGDGVSDGAEDFDADGLGNADEVILGFDATNSDSDGDGKTDSQQDSDNDGITDANEVLSTGSDRFDPDSDDDGIPDGIERILGSGLKDKNSVPLNIAVNPDPVAAGQQLNIAITLSNQGTSTVNNLQAALIVPAGLSFNSTGNAEPDASFCGNGICTAGEEASWTFASLPAGQSVTIQVNALVTAGLPDGALITAPVRITAEGVSSPLLVERTVAVNNTPALQANLSASADPVATNEAFSYSLDIGNANTTDVTGAVYQLQLPAGVTFVSASDGGVYDAAAHRADWTLGTVAAGQRLLRTVQVTVKNDQVNGALLRSHGELRHDGGLALDGRQTHTVVVDNTVPLSASVTASPDPVKANSTLALEFRVSNDGSQPISNLKVLLPVPAGLSFNSTGNAEPDASFCGNGICTAGEEASWTFASLPAGQSVTIQVNALVTAGLPDGTLITAPVRITAEGVSSVLLLSYTVTVKN